MPLIKSKSPQAFQTNVKNLMHEVKTGESPHVKSRAQALAIAYSIKRRSRAEGGGMHIGPIHSAVPGRTDSHDMDVPSGSYVIPAECVSNLGENNTTAGMAKLNEIVHSSPDKIRKFFGSTMPPHLASGGRSSHDGAPVPVKTAGGEYVVSPHVVSIIGYGNTAHGHSVLDKWVMRKRKEHIKTLKGLAPPAKD